ncbi:MAG: tetratricopeptide repeat protein, partial [Xenococcus sp. (in: cyanobacteria)]
MITEDKQQVEYYLRQAIAKHQEGQTEAAIDLYLKSLAIEKLLSDWVYENIIILLAQSGRADQALDLQENALKIHANSDKIYRAIGLAFHYQGNFKNSIDCYLKSLEIEQEQPDWLYA